MMEVFMDGFSVFGNSFETYLSHFDKMLKRCEDTNLCLNWEKSHFMAKEGIILGHKISKNGIEMYKAKVDVIAKLPHPTTVKGEFISHEDLNLKFLRSLPSAWNTHVVVWRNKPDLDTISIDDLYNNFKIVKQEVKGTASLNSTSQNMAFVSSPSTNSTNKVHTAYGVGTASTQLVLISPKWSVTTATRYDILQESADGLGTKIAYSSGRAVYVEETPSKDMVAIDGVGFDWSYIAEDEVPTNMALMVFSDSKVYTNNTCLKTCLKSYESLKKQYDDLKIDFNKAEFDLVIYKKGLESVEEQLVFYKNNKTTLCENIVVLTRDMSIKDSKINVLKSELEKIKQEKEDIQIKIKNFDNASKSLDKFLGSQITNKRKNGLGFQSYNVVPPSATLIYNTGRCPPPKTDLSYSGLKEFKQPEFESYRPKSCEIESKNASKDIPNELKEYPVTPLFKDRVSDNKDFSVESPVVVEKKIGVPTIAKVEVVRPKQQEKPIRKTVRPKAINTARPKAVNTARPSPVVVNVVRANQINETCPISQISRNLMKDMLPLGEEQMVADLLHMDLFGPTFVSSLMHKKYRLVVTDDYRRYTWVFFLATKDETTGILKKFIMEIENLVDKKVKQNGVAERRNRTLIEAARTMVVDSKLPTTFWVEAVNTGCYVQNRALVVKPHNKTPYKLFRGRTPTLSFMRPFRCHVTTLNTLDHLGKFDGKAYEGYLVGYSMNSKAFKVYNIRTRRVEENLHIEFLENKPIVAGARPKWLFDIDMLTKSMNYVPVVAGTNSNDFAGIKDSIVQKHDEVLDKDSRASNELNSTFENLNTEYPDDPKMSGLETIETYDDSEEEADFTNLESLFHVSPTHTTRIHKNHPLKQNYNTHSMGKTIAELHAILKLYEKGILKKVETLVVLAIREGYPKERTGYYFYYRLENKIFVSQNAEFFENSFMVQEASGSYKLLEISGSDKGLELIQEEDTQLFENTSEAHEVAHIEVEPQHVRVPIYRSSRIPQVPDRYRYYVDIEEYELEDFNEPSNYKAALADPEYDKWLEAMNTKIQSMRDNEVWL
nr:hypothetical protein [Tanacetum cinerariifolium]